MICNQQSSQEAGPLQPELELNTLHYSEKILKWNPVCQKNMALFYQFQTGSQTKRSLRVIPDACADFLFCCDDNPSAFISGLQTAPREIIIKPNCTYFGFKPYTTKGMKIMPILWNELLDETASFRDQFGDNGLEAAIKIAASFEERISIFQKFALKKLIDQSYLLDLVEFSEIQLCNAAGNIRVDSLSDQTGYTTRYCRKRFKEALGVSIKDYSNIMRFQNMVRILSQEEESLSDVVLDNGYFDQSHMIKEFKRYSGDTPYRFKKFVLKTEATF